MKTNIGIDIGKRKCDYVMNSRGGSSRWGSTPNTEDGVGEVAERMARTGTNAAPYARHFGQGVDWPPISHTAYSILATRIWLSKVDS